jgi:hypothetical protein
VTNPDVDPIELEDKYHDADEMCAVSVFEYEITYLTEFCEKIKSSEDKDFYTTKIESLSF